MHKKAVFSLAFIMLFAFAATTMAKGGGDDNGTGGGHHGGHGSTTFVVKAGHAEQGGKLQLRARAKKGDRSLAFGATAVVHFASGDVNVTLNRHGKNLDARARVAVGADETLGAISVVVTVTYGATSQTFTVASNVIADPDADPSPEPGED